MNTGRAYHQEALLQALAPSQCLLIGELATRMDVTTRKVTNAAMRLISRGLIERVEAGCFQLTPEGEAARASKKALTSGPNGSLTGLCKKTRKKTLRTRIWRALAAYEKFTVRDLVAVAMDGSEKSEQAAIDNARKYLTALVRVGYLRQLRVRAADTKLTSNGLVRYQRLKHTGSQAPILKQAGIYDPNLKELVQWPTP